MGLRYSSMTLADYAELRRISAGDRGVTMGRFVPSDGLFRLPTIGVPLPAAIPKVAPRWGAPTSRVSAS